MAGTTHLRLRMSDINAKTTQKWVLGAIAVFGVLSIVMFVLASVRGERDADPGALEEQAELAAERAAVPDSASLATSALRVVEQRFDPAGREIEGSILNTTNFSFVNVQVGFDLLASDGRVVGQARDTTSTIGPGETWIFNISLVGDAAASSVRLASLTGGRMDGGAPGTSIDPDRPGRLGPPLDRNAAEGQAYGLEPENQDRN